MAFCTKCGHKNPDENNFCEECGAPIKQAAVPHTEHFISPTPTPAVEPQAKAPAAPRQPRSKKLIVGAVTTVVVLVGIGGGAYFWLSPEPASEAIFQGIIEKSLSTNPEKFSSKVCLDNFDYAKDPVFVNTYDGGTQQWLKLLVDGGVYGPPETVSENSGFFTTTLLRYTKTEAGKNVTKGSRLCFADGVTVTKVLSFTPPQKIGETLTSQANAQLGYRNPMPWTQTPEAKELMPAMFASDITETFTLTLNQDRKWELATALPAAPLAAARNTPAVQASQPDSSSSFFDSIAGMFSGLFSQKPSSVITDMNAELCRSGDLSVMANYVSERSKPAILGMTAMMAEPRKAEQVKNEIQKACKGSESKIEVQEEVITGDRAKVTYREGNQVKSADLVKEQGKWKLDIGPGK